MSRSMVVFQLYLDEQCEYKLLFIIIFHDYLINDIELLERGRSLLACAQSIDSILPVIVKKYREKTIVKAEHRITQVR